MRAATLLLPLALVLTACSADVDAEPTASAGAAEPADSPELTADPAGTVVDLDPDAEGMVFDPVTGLLAVAVRDPDRLVLTDADGVTQLEVPLPGHARHLQLAAPGGPVLVPAEDSNILVEVALPGGATTETAVGDYPHDAAQVASGQILVGDEKGGTLSVVTDGEVTQTFDSQTQPGGVAVVGDVAGVVDVGAFTLTGYEVAAGELQTVLDAGAGPTHVAADSQGRFLVADTRGDAVLVFGADPLELQSTYDLPGTPYGLGYDSTDQVLWVTLTATNEVVGLSTAGAELTEVARFPTVRQPNTVAVDPASGRVFVGSRETGQLQLIDARTTTGG